MTYVLYELDTGRNHSQSEEVVDNPDTGRWGVKETQLSGIWNESTLDFDPRLVDKRMTTLAFMELFTEAELMGILDAAKVSTQVEVFVMKMEQAEFMDLNYQPTIDAISGLATFGLLTTARAAEILNG